MNLDLLIIPAPVLEIIIEVASGIVVSWRHSFIPEAILPCNREDCIWYINLVQGCNMTTKKSEIRRVWLQSGNIIRQCFEFGISQFLGNDVHHATWAVAAIARPEIDKLPSQIFLLLTAYHRE